MYSNVFKTSFVKSNFKYEELTVPEKTSLFNEGDKNDYVYFIENGAINVFKNNLLIGITKNSEFVGITSCLSEQEFYTFSTKAKTGSSLLRIKQQDFKQLILENKEFSDYIMKILCERIKITDLKTKSYLDKTYEKRLIFEIISHSFFDGLNFKVIISIDELKILTGIPKKIIEKLINNFVSKELIKKKKSELIILNYEKLKCEL